MVVSSVTPRISLPIIEYQPGLAASCFRMAAKRTVSSSLVGIGQHGGVLLGPRAQMDEQGGVTAVVEDHVRAAIAELEDPVGEVPVFRERLALVREDRRAARGDGRRRVILRGEDVAGRPADLRAQRLQRLDEDGGLDRHVQRARRCGRP